MANVRKVFRQLQNLFCGNRIEDDLSEELRFHLESEIEKNVAVGMTPKEARYAALRNFGGVEQVKEVCRDVRGVRWVENFRQDLSFGFRMLVKSPGFTAVAIIALALGIGANTAIFSVINAAFLAPVPYKDPDRLVYIMGTNLRRGEGLGVSMADFLDWRAQNHVFEQMAANGGGANFNVTYSAEPDLIWGAYRTPNYFSTLGVEPILGRNYLPDEEQPGHDSSVILNNRCWRRRFGADPNVIGKRLSINGRNFTVAGVLPVGLNGASEVLMPLVPSNYLADRADRSWEVIARLKPGITLQQANADMQALARGIELQYPDSNKDYGVRVVPLSEAYAGGAALTPVYANQSLLMMLGAVALVTLMACTNVANLILGRAVSRQKEFVIRTVLGSGRARLIRQLLTENLMLFLCGGTLGVVLAIWCKDLLVTVGGAYIPDTAEVTVDTRVLAFSLLLSLLTGFLFGLAPALQASRINLNDLLKDSGQAMAGGLRRNKTRRVLIISELALAMVLLISFGLLIRSFLQVLAVPMGFDPNNILTAAASLPASKYDAAPRRAAFQRSVIEQALSLPGIKSAGLTTAMPLGGAGTMWFSVEGHAPIPEGQEATAKYISVSPDFFSTMSTPILKGRSFTNHDVESARPVAIINETMARHHFPNEDPLGQRVRMEDSPKVWREIVGVVADMRQRNLDEESAPIIYRPSYQMLDSDLGLVVRTHSSSDIPRIAASLRAHLRAVDKDLAWDRVVSMQQIIYESESLSLRRPIVVILGTFGVMALILTAVGVYGVIAYSVTERTREIGVRMALGASQSHVLRKVLGETILLTIFGELTGTCAALALTRLFRTDPIGWYSSGTLLFGVTRTDPVTYGAVALLLATIAVLASCVPARRAARVDPMMALRYE
jgi:putative ABC transport system permease protein